ncbi:MAG: T9SS type A sorting domain-containing protein [Bacteroidetes bacterium]|nr:T9SS type A sorting domain-containing protein [Bacteroidota bacterium]
MIKYILLFLPVFSLASADNFWERNEPYSGVFQRMYFAGGDTIYGIQSSGYLLSTDNGDSWSKPVIVDYITGMAVAPNGTMYFSQNQYKMSRSTNKGSSWVRVGGKGINENSCSAVIVTSQGNVIASTSTGLYRSTDLGENFTKVAGANELSADTTIVVLATYNGSTLYAFSRNTTLFYSTDDGITWTQGTHKLDSVSVLKAEVAPNGTIFAKTNNGLRSSSDGGNTWNPAQFYGTRIVDFFITRSGEIYVTLDNKSAKIYKSTDNGLNWTTIPLLYTTTNSIGVNDAGHIFVGNNITLRSTDNGATWKGLPVSFSQVGKMIESPNHELFTTVNQRLNRSVDFGATWTIFNEDINGANAIAFYGDTLLVGDNNYETMIYRSTDNGLSFSKMQNLTGISGKIYSMVGTSVPSIIAATTSGIFLSEDHGKTWTKTSTGIVYWLQQVADGTIYGYREFFGSGVFRSTDNGNSWQELKTGIGNTIIRSISVAPNGNVFTATESGLFRSTDKGDNWVRIDTQKVKPYGIYATVNKDGILFFGGAKNGINSNSYQSTDNGATWQYLNNMASIDNQANILGFFASSDGRIFSFTSAGLFRSVQIPTSVRMVENSIPLRMELQQNYPNPFNPATTIRYSVPAMQKIELKVYDLLGREVQTLVNEVQSQGSYEVRFDASTLASGIYIYRLQSGSFVTTKKMMVLK